METFFLESVFAKAGSFGLQASNVREKRDSFAKIFFFDFQNTGTSFSFCAF